MACDCYLPNVGSISRLNIVRGARRGDSTEGLRADMAGIGSPSLFRGLIRCSFWGDEPTKHGSYRDVESWQLDVPTKTLRLAGKAQIWESGDD